MTKKTNIQATRKNASKAFVGITYYIATTGALSFSIADLAFIGEAWKKERYVEPTISEFSDGLRYLEKKVLLSSVIIVGYCPKNLMTSVLQSLLRRLKYTTVSLLSAMGRLNMMSSLTMMTVI